VGRYVMCWHDLIGGVSTSAVGARRYKSTLLFETVPNFISEMSGSVMNIRR
jgi:hypothetical protein